MSYCIGGALFMWCILAAVRVHTLELRCYCNLPQCVSSSYMCKSRTGCFQELPLSTDDVLLPYKHRHGCLELWRNHTSTSRLRKVYRCLEEFPSALGAGKDLDPGRTTRSARTNVVNLRCCTEDMCNYAIAPHQQLMMAEKALVRGRDDNVLSGSSHMLITTGHVLSPDVASNDAETEDTLRALHLTDRVWFRAALVAIPLGGCIALLLLAWLACWFLSATARELHCARSKLIRAELVDPELPCMPESTHLAAKRNVLLVFQDAYKT